MCLCVCAQRRRRRRPPPTPSLHRGLFRAEPECTSLFAVLLAACAALLASRYCCMAAPLSLCPISMYAWGLRPKPPHIPDHPPSTRGLAAQMLCRCCTDAPLRSCSPHPTLPLLARSPPHSRTSPPSFVATRATDHERGHAASFPSAVLAFGRIQPRCRAGGRRHASALLETRKLPHPSTRSRLAVWLSGGIQNRAQCPAAPGYASHPAGEAPPCAGGARRAPLLCDDAGAAPSRVRPAFTRRLVRRALAPARAKKYAQGLCRDI